MDQPVKSRPVKRDVSQPKGRQVDDQSISEVSALLGDLERRKDLLIEALHLVQDGIGCLHARHLAALGELFKLAQVEVYEVASFYHHFDIVKEHEKPPAPVTVRICDGLTCTMKGANKLIEEYRGQIDPDKVRIEKVPCIGRCEMAPAANVGQCAVGHATPESLTRSAAGSLQAELSDYQDFAGYQGEGGYSALAKILSGVISAEQATKTMSDGGLRGLGGAGFPAGRKWGFVANYDGPRLMTINGDEGEPGTFKDRWWLESKPHRMLEGALIAAHVVGCERIYFYLRDEYHGAREIMRREIAALEDAGLLSTPIEMRRGAGAYICGEESAMIESIEGKRGLPRHRPPYIAEVGLFGRPTLNHNIETLSWVPDILNKGAAWFADQGWSDEHTGLRSFSVSGRVKEPGVKLAPAGIPLAKLIENYCGGMADGHVFKAFFPGGASGGLFPASMANMAMDFGVFEPFGGLIGSHAVVILSDQDSMRDAVMNTMQFFRHESCGQCTPCRSGTEKIVQLLQEHSPDRSLIDDIMFVMRDSSICGLGQAASNSVAHLIKYFPEELT